MKHTLALLTLLSVLVSGVTNARAINIVVDYSLDSNNFFTGNTAAQTALQAAADRYSAIISTSLTAVGPGDSTNGWRVGATHPGTGASLQISSSANVGADPLSGSSVADQYGFSLNADEWTLFAGGRALGSAGVGGTGTGLNFTSVFNDVNGPLHRGINDNMFGGGSTVNDLPRWGGAISFDTGTAWNFDLASTGGGLDFYSIALHEIGHALGLSTSWNQWQDDGSGLYIGSNAVAAYNADNGTSLTSLNQVSTANNHLEDGTYDSYLFPGGNTVGTVPDGTQQDLLMEPIANFGGLQQRFELTNVDVAALEDLGWDVVPEPSRALLTFLGFAVATLRRRR